MTQLLITCGEPAGIGLEVTLKALRAWLPRVEPTLPIRVIGDADWISHTTQQMGVALPANVSLWHQPLAAPVEPGQLNPANADYVLALLDRAIAAAQAAPAESAIVTAPIQKSILMQRLPHFQGHTEYLAEKTQTPRVVMMLASAQLRVALVTTHLPLAQVPLAITQQAVQDTLTIVQRALAPQLGSPRITVLGLNPHSGESGMLGREELDHIIPAIEWAQRQGYSVIGPLPADTAFQTKYRDTTDCYIAMYHDQGLPVIKYAAFGELVNVTLGLPFIRTSVDHGTALDLAGKNSADEGSMVAALDTAYRLLSRDH